MNLTKNPERCRCCGQVVSPRVITIYSGMVKALVRIWYWCKENDRNEFSRKEIKHLFKGKDNEIARWGDWIIFGDGMVYKPDGKGTWGLRMDLVGEFLSNNKQIPTKVNKDPITKHIEVMELGFMRDIKNLSHFLDESGLYIAKYLKNEPKQKQLFME